MAPEAGLAGPGPKWKELMKDRSLFDAKERELLQERVKREVARATDQALREVARATEQAKRATEQAQRAYEQAANRYLKTGEDMLLGVRPGPGLVEQTTRGLEEPTRGPRTRAGKAGAPNPAPPKRPGASGQEVPCMAMTTRTTPPHPSRKQIRLEKRKRSEPLLSHPDCRQARLQSNPIRVNPMSV